MALQIWLPLVADTNSQGLPNIAITATNVTADNNGKIGKCYGFNSTSSYFSGTQNFITNDIGDWSYACWMKLNSTKQGQCLFSCRTTTNSSGITIFYYGSQWYIDDGARWSFTPTNTIAIDTWYHICVVRKKDQGKFLYVNGLLDSSTTTVGTPTDVNTNYFSVGCSQNGASTFSGNWLNGYLNDVRFYDNALSVKEIKELAKAKVVHYPFNDNSIQQLSNVYSSPTFNTSSASGGWNHWGGSGHIGTYGQNTDKQYIFNKYNTYSHWFANDTGATYNYMLYQSPAFEGGYRSLCCILKEQNSLPITESIVYPTWNARSGGVPHGKWTSVQLLGDGFYLCKVEGLQQDGSNDLVGLYVTAGNKVYVSEAYLENDRTVCSDIRYYNSTLYDCSGNNYHGTCNASMIMNNSSPRSKYSTTFNGTSDSIAITRPFESTVKNPEMTFAFWINRNDYSDETQRMIYNGICQLYLYTDYKLRITWTHAKADSSNKNTWAIGLLVPAGEWHHVCVMFKGGVITVYYDGEFYRSDNRSSTGQFMGGAYATTQSIGYNQFGGSLSDFRIYATALSADDVKALYNVGASVDDRGNMFTYEFDEV